MQLPAGAVAWLAEQVNHYGRHIAARNSSCPPEDPRLAPTCDRCFDDGDDDHLNDRDRFPGP